jgi:hypothetical protein
MFFSRVQPATRESTVYTDDGRQRRAGTMVTKQTIHIGFHLLALS